MPSHVGRLLKRSQYRLFGLVGQGQFGRVYCAMHRQTGRLVALKNLEQQRFPTHKFLRELRFLLSLQHPNIVTCQAIEHSRTGRYLVMDYCEGGTLRGLMDAEGRLHPTHCVSLAIDILSGLEHAHGRGIVHCDIKPENILLNVRTDGWVARISDFGIARLHQELAEASSESNTGSPAYMAPERFYGQYSPTSDLYSVGILLYELLSGDRPFSGTPVELRAAHLNQPLTFPDHIPEPWRPILATALQKLAGRRFRTATEMLTAVRHLNMDKAESQVILADLSHPLPIQRKLPLLIPDALPAVPVVTERQIELTAPIYTVSATVSATVSTTVSGANGLPQSLEVYWADGETIGRRVIDCAGEANQEQSTQIEAPVQALHRCDRGCLAVTTDTVYLLFRSPTQELSTHSVSSITPGSVVATSGRWVAIAQNHLEGTAGTLDVLPLWGGGGRRQGIPLPYQQRSPRDLRLLWLDTRHLAVINSSTDAGEKTQGSRRTRIDIMNRRGHRLCHFNLPVPLSKVMPTSIPHRLLAIDPTDPGSIVLIDLMPYRIRRIGLEVIPYRVTATAWGSAIADPQGIVVLLDHQGQRLGKLETGLTTPTVVDLHSHYLGIVTEAERPILHLLDLTQPGLDLTF